MLVQTQMLLDENPSAPLVLLQDRLRVLQVAAELREERSARLAAPAAATAAAALLLAPDSEVEVSEATAEEYDASERSWVGTVPQKLPPAEP